MGAWNAGGIGRNRDSEPISDFTDSCQRCDHRRIVTSCDTTASSKRRRLLFTGDVDEMLWQEASALRQNEVGARCSLCT